MFWSILFEHRHGIYFFWWFLEKTRYTVRVDCYLVWSVTFTWTFSAYSKGWTGKQTWLDNVYMWLTMCKQLPWQQIPFSSKSHCLCSLTCAFWPVLLERRVSDFFYKTTIVYIFVEHVRPSFSLSLNFWLEWVGVNY